jgi:hypothetical protein
MTAEVRCLSEVGIKPSPQEARVERRANLQEASIVIPSTSGKCAGPMHKLILLKAF